MSTCRVTALSTPAAIVHPPAQERTAIEPALIFHTHFEWNSSGTRIRCAHTQCAEVFTVTAAGDIDAADAVFAEHQAKTLGALPVELAALRALKDALPGLVTDLAHGAPPLRIQASLFQLIAEADYAIGGAAELIIEAPREPKPDTQPEPATAVEADTQPEPEVSAEPEPAEELPEPEAAILPEAPEIQEPAVEPALDVADAAVDVSAVDVSAVDVSAIAVGDRVRAVFATEKHGTFEVEATVVAGVGLDQLVVGSWLISSSGSAAVHLREVTLLAGAAVNDQPVKPGSAAPEHFGPGV